MATIVERAQNGKARAQRLADQISGVFVPIVIVLSILTLIGWLVFGPSAEWAFRAAVATLIIACPCALGLATPTALLAGTGRGAELGILLSGPEALEASRHVDTVVLDKTGTLTTGSMSVSHSVVWHARRDDFWSYLVSVESTSSHPIAQALVAHAPAATVVSVEQAAADAGFGVSGTIDGHSVQVGRSSWLAAGELVVPDELAEAFYDERLDAYTAVWLAVDGELWGGVYLSDEPKVQAQATITALHNRGLQVVLLTGDSQGPAEHVAGQLGIDRVIAGVSPEGKVQAVTALQDEGHRVAMVGDGINDAPALATANVGIALGSGTDQAMSAGDITITRGDIEQVPTALALASKTLGTIRGNLFWAFAYNVVAIPLAVGGVLNPLIAGAAMAFSSVFVVTNSLRLRRFRATTAAA
jgi:Cu+-exporting ATPase